MENDLKILFLKMEDDLKTKLKKEDDLNCIMAPLHENPEVPFCFISRWPQYKFMQIAYFVQVPAKKQHFSAEFRDQNRTVIPILSNWNQICF
jgi:hypothetical protein